VTRDEYERSKARLEEQRRYGVELVETAYQAQVRALDLVWMLQGEEGIASRAPVLVDSGPAAPASASQEPLPRTEPPRHRSTSEVEDDVRAALAGLPETFTRRDVCKVLGYEPDRGALYRILCELTEKGLLHVQSRGGGQRATVYRIAGGDDSPAST
jgi:hypothetical protein